MALTKQQQWRMAHTVVNMVAEMYPNQTENYLLSVAHLALERTYDPAPFEYEWHTVILSVAEQRTRRIAKRLK